MFPLALVPSLPPGLPAQEADPIVTAYPAAGEARDAETLAALWLEHPARILTTFDADLGAGLATWERTARRSTRCTAARRGRPRSRARRPASRSSPTTRLL